MEPVIIGFDRPFQIQPTIFCSVAKAAISSQSIFKPIRQLIHHASFPCKFAHSKITQYPQDG
jgi:hypothetical protein